MNLTGFYAYNCGNKSNGKKRFYPQNSKEYFKQAVIIII